MIGRTISHYVIRERLGRGGMGVVYRAEDTRLRRDVALKFITPAVAADPEARTRLIHEAQAAAALDHPHICAIHGIEEADGELFIVMALAEGENLAARIERGPLPLAEALDLTEQVGEGLQAAHERGVVHRDIKPANIVVSDRGQVRILDFGLATSPELTRLTGPGTTLGTVAYMSPEQARGETVDRRTDIWSLAVMLQEMITGQRPFRGEHEQALLRSILNDDPPLPTSLRSGLPIELDRILEKALSKAPAERYQHVDELRVDLRRLRTRFESGATVAATRPTTAAAGGRARKRIAFLTAPLVVLLAAAAFLLAGPLVCDRGIVARPIPIAVVSFENQTGDAAYDYLQTAVPNLLITSLEESPQLRVMTWERMQDLLRQMGKPSVELIDRELGFELCRQGGIQTIVLGTLTRAGDTFATDVKVLDVASMELLAGASAQGRGVGSILESQIDAISRDIRQATGLTGRRTDPAAPPITELTTTSLDGYQLFLRGRDAQVKLYYADSRRDLLAAVQRDSTFAEAWYFLARACGSLGHGNESREAIETALRLSVRAPEKLRLYIEAYHASRVEKDDQKASSILEQLVRRYPDEKAAHYLLGSSFRTQSRNREAIASLQWALTLDPEYSEALNLLAYAYTDLKEYDRAEDYLERYAAVQPGDANPFDSMADLYFRLGELDRARTMYEKALAARPDFGGAGEKLAYIHALGEDYANALQCLDRLMAVLATPGEQAWPVWWRGFYLHWLGRGAEADQAYDRAEVMMREVGNEWGQVLVVWARAALDFERGRPRDAREDYERLASLLPPSSLPRVQVMLLFCQGRLDLAEGNMVAAEARLAEMDPLAAQVPEPEHGNAVALVDMLRGSILADRRRYEEAAGFLAKARDEAEWFSPGVERFAGLNTLLPTDGLARVYAALGRLDDAIAEYERLTSSDVVVRNILLIRPRHHYDLGRLYEQKGETGKAIAGYRRFLEIWNRADPGPPEIADARARLAALGADGS